jgi:hypothetical protein
VGDASQEEASVTNASRCLSRAARYAKLAERAEDPEIRRACRALAEIWREIEPHAADFDRMPDPLSKQRIYELIDAVAAEQRKVA